MQRVLNVKCGIYNKSVENIGFLSYSPIFFVPLRLKI